MGQWERSCILPCGLQYLLLVQHVVWMFRVHTKTGVPALETVMGGALVELGLVKGPVVGGTLEGGTLVDGTVDRGMFTCVRGSLEGVQLGAVMVVMMVGGGNSTPCIWWEGGKKEGRGRRRRSRDHEWKSSASLARQREKGAAPYILITVK